jgi:ribosomal protein S18 acetylase RimI-like enzyme
VVDAVVDLRRATAADAGRMAAIAEAAYAPYVERMGGQRPAPMDEDYDHAVAHTEAWVVEDAGFVIGFLVLIGQGEAMLLDNVAVDPAHQGRGAGRALLTLAEDRARSGGYDRITLYTHQAMVENQGLYERVGFVETRRAVEHGFARVFYEKPLLS